MANILICGCKVPFTSGGQEVLVNTLIAQLKKRDHLVDRIELPLAMLPKENLINQIAWWRSLNLEEFSGYKVDLVIGTKFPSYFVKHRRKSVWLVHQHRAIYELYGTRYSDISDDPRDEQLRRMLYKADTEALSEAQKICAISNNVAERLKNYNALQAETVNPPLPQGNAYRIGEFQNYVLSVARLCSIKRVDLIIKALPIIHNFVKLKVVGVADEPGIMDYFKNEIDKHHLWDRVEFLGRVSDEDLIDLYANAGVVYYAPHNEDYGYVTLEAMASGKPVVTALDSGGTLQFIQHEETGLVVEPNTDAIGHAVNRLIENQELARELGNNGRTYIENSGLLEHGWDQVINQLLLPLES